MEVRRVKVINSGGLHTRPAAEVVKLAQQFDSKFFIIKGASRTNGRSIIGVMSLAASQGSHLELEFEGAHEKEAADAIAGFFANGFDEPM